MSSWYVFVRRHSPGWRQEKTPLSVANVTHQQHLYRPYRTFEHRWDDEEVMSCQLERKWIYEITRIFHASCSNSVPWVPVFTVEAMLVPGTWASNFLVWCMEDPFECLGALLLPTKNYTAFHWEFLQSLLILTVSITLTSSVLQCVSMRAHSHWLYPGLWQHVDMSKLSVYRRTSTQFLGQLVLTMFWPMLFCFGVTIFQGWKTVHNYV